MSRAQLRPRRSHTAVGTALVAAALLGSLLSPVPASAGTGDAASPGVWKQFRGGPRHHGANAHESVLAPGNVGGLEKTWTTLIGQAVFASPTVTRTCVLVGVLDGRLHALDRTTGEEAWSYPPDALDGDTVWTSPAVARGTVYFAANRPGAVIYALDAKTGALRWTRSYFDIVISSPVVARGVVTFAFNDGSLRALDAKTGADVWTYDGSGGAYSSPAVVGKRLFISIHNRGLLSLNAKTGAERWIAPMSGPQWSSPAIAHGVVYVGSRDDESVFAFSARTGERLWQAETSGWVHSSPAVADGVVYVGNETGDVYALNAADGDELWSTRLAAGVFGGPTVGNGVVYVATGLGDGKLVALDAATGDVLFSDFIGDGDQSGDGEWAQASPTVVGGMVYIGSYESDSYLTAFGLPTGSARSSVPDTRP